MKNERIYLDLEYLYPGMTAESGRPTSVDQRQIVQIAAIRFDHKEGREIAHFDQLVIPTYARSLPAFFTELTQITDCDLKTHAIPLEQALNSLLTFIKDTPIWIFDLDKEVLEQNCSYIGKSWPFHNTFTRVKPLLSTWGIDPNQYSSGTLYQSVGVDMNGHVHNALHDVRSMSVAIHYLESKKYTHE